MEELVRQDPPVDRGPGVAHARIQDRDPAEDALRGPRRAREHAAIGVDEEQGLEEQGFEGVPVGGGRVGPQRAQVPRSAGPGVQEAFGVGRAPVRPELEAVGVDQVGKPRGDQDVEVVEVPDHDPGLVDAGHRPVQVQKQRGGQGRRHRAPEARFGPAQQRLGVGDELHGEADHAAGPVHGGLQRRHDPRRQRRELRELGRPGPEALAGRVGLPRQSPVVGVVRPLVDLEGPA